MLNNESYLVTYDKSFYQARCRYLSCRPDLSLFQTVDVRAPGTPYFCLLRPPNRNIRRHLQLVTGRTNNF